MTSTDKIYCYWGGQVQNDLQSATSVACTNALGWESQCNFVFPYILAKTKQIEAVPSLLSPAHLPRFIRLPNL